MIFNNYTIKTFSKFSIYRNMTGKLNFFFFLIYMMLNRKQNVVIWVEYEIAAIYVTKDVCDNWNCEADGNVGEGTVLNKIMENDS